MRLLVSVLITLLSLPALSADALPARCDSNPDVFAEDYLKLHPELNLHRQAADENGRQELAAVVSANEFFYVRLDPCEHDGTIAKLIQINSVVMPQPDRETMKSRLVWLGERLLKTVDQELLKKAINKPIEFRNERFYVSIPSKEYREFSASIEQHDEITIYEIGYYYQ